MRNETLPTCTEDGIPVDNTWKMFRRDLKTISPMDTEERETLLAYLIPFQSAIIEQIKEARFSALDPNIISTYRRLVEGNQGLMIFQSRKYKGRGLKFMELVSEANVAFMESLQDLDLQKGEMSTHAVWRMRHKLGRACENNGRLIRVPADCYTEMYCLHKKQQELEKKLNRFVTIEELATFSGFTVEKITRLQRYFSKPFSLHKKVKSDDGEIEEFGDTLSDSKNCEIEVETKLIHEQVLALVNALPDTEQRVIKMRYGLNQEDRCFTLKEVGESLGIKPHQVALIEKNVLRQLGNSLN